MRKLVLAFGLFLLMAYPLFAVEPLKIGILAHRPKTQVAEQWNPLAEKLNKVVPGYDFSIVAYDFHELQAAVAARQIDFVLTNPGNYILMARRSGLSAPLVTLSSLEQGRPIMAFGGVIFTRSKRKDIQQLGDLRGKTIAMVDTASMGGYQAQAYELMKFGMRLPQEIQPIKTGMPHDKVVEAVLTGRADVGFVRSGLLEALTSEGKLDIKQIAIINRQILPTYPAMLSTPLYPEWVFAAMPNMDRHISQKIVAVLLALEEDKMLTRVLNIHGFHVPSNYTPVVEMLTALRMPPFDTPSTFTVYDIWDRYRVAIMTGLLAIALLMLLGAKLLASNQRLQAEKKVVLNLNRNLSKTETSLRHQSQRLGEVIWGANIATWDWEVQTGALVINDRSATIVGYTLEELAPISLDTWDKLMHPDDGKLSGDLLARACSGDLEFYECEVRMRHKDGHWIWVLDRGRVVEWAADDKALRMAGTHLDITERKQSEEKLKLAASVFTHAREGIMITDADATIIEVNNTFCLITGYSHEDVLGKNPRILQSGRQSRDFYAAMWESLLEQKHWSGEFWNRRKNGEVFAQLTTISAICDANGTIQNYVALFTDITLQKEHQQQLEHIAHYDALTGLPNRVLLADRLQQAMSQSKRQKKSLAVAYLDLDGFKAINDSHDHEVGDELLIALSQRMKEALRGSDTLARIGGDEFVAVLVDLKKMTDCEPVLARLLRAASSPIAAGNATLQVSASIGVTLYPQDGADADQLMRHADHAMYVAKQAGKNRYQLFDVHQDEAIKTQRESLDAIRGALDHREFVLYYQPKVNMKTGEVIGAEGLIRWQHPERGLVPPGDFLPIIESHPLSVELGEWVIDTALTQIAEWHTAGLDIPVSVNVGARQLQQDFVTTLSAALARHPEVKPCWLELEILETSALEDITEVSAIMRACHELGVGFALDDFGTGYSSLTYLRHLPANLLKIDQSFVRNMLDDPDDRAIVMGVIGLATAFHRQVIAEGVETIAHGTRLLPMGCVLAQGYGIARPMPASDLPAWAASWKPDASWTI